jgi:hypothetical protein
MEGNFELSPYLKFVNEKFEEFSPTGSENCKAINVPIEKMKSPKRVTLYGPPDPSIDF